MSDKFEEETNATKLNAIFAFAAKMKDEFDNELELIHKTVANLITGYSELVTMVDSLVVSLVDNGNDEIKDLFIKTLEEKRAEMLALLQNNLNLQNDEQSG